MYVIPVNVIQLLFIAISAVNLPRTPITEQKKQFSKDLENMIIEAMDQPMKMDVETGLDFLSPNGIHEAAAIEDDSEGDWHGQRYLDKKIDENVCAQDIEELSYEHKTRAVYYWRSGANGNRKLSSVQTKFKKVKSEPQLRRWAHSINKGGTYKEKFTKIAHYTLNNFNDVLDKRLPVHDIDLRRWALRAREIVEIPAVNFQASASWLRTFKNQHGIVSRKITKYVTRQQLLNADTLQNKATEFIEMVKVNITDVGAEDTINSDQSGFNLELHTGRTLAKEGQKSVETVVQSKTSTTHSYTIQPSVSASGKFVVPILIVLNEPTGKVGPRVEQTMFGTENIFLMASKSGKLTTNHFKRWFQEVYFPSTGPKSVILLDSWSGQCPTAFKEMNMQGKYIKVLTILAGTTGMIQPLDVYGFCVWINFVKHFSDAVILYNYDVNLHLRGNIIKLQSLTHNQFSSPRFTNLFKYAWYKSGYEEERPPNFENPVEFCFSQNVPTCDICGEAASVTRAWCKKSFCFKQFYHDDHYCNKYNP